MAQAAPSKYLPDPAHFVRDHPIWILSLTPFFLAALKLLVVSYGNVEILRYLVQNLDPVQLILATVIPLIPVAAFWLIPVATVVTFSPRMRAYSKWIRVSGLICVSLVLIYFALQSIFFSLLVNTALFLFLVFFWTARAVISKFFPARQGRIGAVGARQSILVIYLLMLCASLTTVLSNWLPSEIIHTKGDANPTVGYIISSKDDWTVILTLNGGRDILIVSKQQVVQREACVYRSWTTRPFLEFIQDNPPISSCPGEKDWLDRSFRKLEFDSADES